MLRTLVRRFVVFCQCLIPLVGFFHCAGRQPQTQGQIEFVTIEEELRLGEELRSFTIQHLNIIRNRALGHYFSDMAQKLGAVSHWQGLDYTIFIINEPDVNHFSLPGGNIYLFRGLIETAETPHEVAAVIAHEIAHLSRRDAVSRMAEKYGFALAAQDVMGSNPEIAQHIIASLYKEGTILDYPMQNEYIADEYALEYLQDAHYDPAGLLDILQTFQQVKEQQPQRLQLLLFTHPPIASRLKQVQNHLEAMAAFTNDRVLPDSTFLELKKTLSRIPR